MLKKLGKIAYYLVFGLIILIAIGVIAPLLPIPGNYNLLTVLSGSMEPAIKTGSIVMVKPVDNYKIGDTITFGKKKKVPTTHRIVDVQVDRGNPFYFTKGDANSNIDSYEVPESDVIGKVLFSLPYAGYVVDVAKKPYGFALIIIIPALIIIFDEGTKVWKEVKKIKN